MQLLLALLPLGIIHASESGGAAGKTLSPYFLIKGGDNSTDEMPLKSTDVDVKIVGVIADVRIFKN